MAGWRMARPYEISGVLPGGFRVAFSDSFPAVFPMESPEDIPEDCGLFFRALPGDRCKIQDGRLEDGTSI